ncbi:hypothetical protein EQV77_04770 [Halobacillus fulvus]|nr:hypothetical protein EQV77_04770 [Halobacillus fulvus]
MEQQHYHNQTVENSGFPWKALVGFILCVILTAFALGGFLYSSYEPKLLLLLVSGLAFAQAFIELFKMQPQD